MSKNIEKNFSDVEIIEYLKKNKNFFLKYSGLIEQLELPIYLKRFNKVVDLNAYRSQKIKEDSNQLKKQISDIIKAGSSHINSQKRILKTSLKILNTKSLEKLIDLFTKDLGGLLGCDSVNCFCTSNDLKQGSLSLIDRKVASSYFRDKPQTNLNQNPKGILIFFPNKSKIITSYILLKINYVDNYFVIAMGSKDNNKFTKDQQIDLVEYLIKIIEIKLRNLKH